MSPLAPVRVYGLEVQAGDVPIPAIPDEFAATLRITMAAIDPSAEPQLDASANSSVPRATLKIVRLVNDDEDESDDEDDDIDAIERRLGGVISDEEDDEESSDEEANGGPSDPAKSKKARKAAAVKQLLEALKGADDMEVDAPNGVNGKSKSKSKGKGKVSDDEEEDSDLEEEDDDDDDDFEGEIEEFVICTLDPEKHYQQPLDITIGENEQVYFKVTGTHNVYLTGNYVIDPVELNGEGDYDSEEEDLDYELGSDEDDEDEESDDLDDLEDPRITEIDTDEEEAPKLVKAEKKGKNKRPADESAANGLDELINKSLKSKKQKNNAGDAIAAEKSAEKTPPSAKSDKKVQFAKNLEQGPTGSPTVNKKDAKKDDKKDAKKEDSKPKAALGPKTISGGIKVDDRKLGSGPAAKNGDKVGMRYIGKLEKDGKVFDSNKKGKPFTFALGKGQVIKGWDLGIAGMQVGGERRIVIPAPMAYGSKGVPGIPPNATLVFDVKMLSLN